MRLSQIGHTRNQNVGSNYQVGFSESDNVKELFNLKKIRLRMTKFIGSDMCVFVQCSDLYKQNIDKPKSLKINDFNFCPDAPSFLPCLYI